MSSATVSFDLGLSRGHRRYFYSSGVRTSAIHKEYSGIPISRTLGFTNLPISRTKPCFPWICFTQTLQFHPRFLETPDNSNQFWLPWDKLTLDNSNLAKTSKPLNSFSFSPRRRFVFQTEISSKYIVLVLISRLFYFLSWGSVYRFLYRIQNARGVISFSFARRALHHL